MFLDYLKQERFGMLVLYILAIVVLYGLYILVAKYYKRTLNAQNEVILKPMLRKVLLVTAHPDDEVMFFAPSIFNLVEMLGKENIYLLCLTNGDFYGEGNTREKELVACCRRLGISPSNMAIVNNENFQDDPKATWDTVELSGLIQKCAEKFGVNSLLSFDAYGVSGHKNHMDIHQAIISLKQFVRLILIDVSIVRKYSSVFDVFFTSAVSYFSTDPSYVLFLNSPLKVLQSYMAMHCHKSQFTWFRKLYFLYSRYLLLNQIRIIAKGK